MTRKGILGGAALALVLAGAGMQAQTPPSVVYTVGTGEGELSLVDAIKQANQYTGGTSVEINIDASDFSDSTISLTSQMIIGLYSSTTAGLTINGNGATINMNNADRAFFIASGTVNINNLAIINGNATGGNGADGAGGGAGLGGAIFVANPTVIVGSSTPNANLTLPTAVTLTNVTMTGNRAVGGNGAGYQGSGQGGGGGMGGNGGMGYYDDPGPFDYNQYGSGGGGGFGVGANGGTAASLNPYGGDGAFAGGWFATTPAPGGNGGHENDDVVYTGGAGGGGGGASVVGSFLFATQGGGGGVGGLNGGGPTATGGFGGGGAGNWSQSAIEAAVAGDGGFGGGGGGGKGLAENNSNTGAGGGFGGGGGAADDESVSDGPGGFAAGSGVSGPGIGGGGAGLGGALFVMQGASLTIIQDDSGGAAGFSGNTVAGGGTPVGGQAGSAYGYDLFLGNDVTFHVASSLTVSGLGGAGNTSDHNVANAPSEQVGMAQGGLIKKGAGTLTLAGDNYYTGQTVIHSGTLTLAAAALEQGTSGVIVGQNAGDNATLAFLSGSTLNLTGSTGIVVGQEAGATGAVIIGQDGMDGADLGLATISGGAGGGQIIFAQSSSAGGPGPYSMLSNLTGNLSVVQNGPGTTILSPLAAYGNNTYTGGTQVQQGTLQVGGTNALGTGGVTVTGGTLVVQGGSAITNDVTLGGGSYTVAVNAAGSYANMANATSSFGNGRATTASVLGGTASAATTLATSFATTATAANSAIQLSDVYSFSGTSGDIFVLELSMTSVEAGTYLGWLNTATNEWVNAVEGNTGNNATAAQQGFLGSYADFLTAYQGEQLADYIGAYGVDASTDPDTGTQTVTVWAVLNHNSDFAIVPEPSTWALVIGGGLVLVLATLRRRAREERTR